MNRNQTLKRLAQTLLASTCLTVATASAGVTGVVTESTDFSNDQAMPTLLPTGTTTVNGGLCGDCISDPADWFTIPGLGPGDTIAITETLTRGGTMDYLVGDSSENTLASGTLSSLASPALPGPTSPAPSSVMSFDVTAPTDGNLVFGAGNSAFAGYTVTITDLGVATPEPGTVGTAALALATAAVLRRKRRKA
ncbi:MAG: hypothetical protein KGN84_14690 [Acidobacteriota bacterium]|nr:hypothetical protein [Acidobacteriota bacterium]